MPMLTKKITIQKEVRGGEITETGEVWSETIPTEVEILIDEKDIAYYIHRKKLFTDFNPEQREAIYSTIKQMYLDGMLDDLLDNDEYFKEYLGELYEEQK
jgi:hypothetical protein